MVEKERDLGTLYKFSELYENGVRVGDIVALPSNRFATVPSWDYVLLRDGFPEDYNASLCCYRDSRTPDKVYLQQLGFHWCGSTEHMRFRIANEHERKDFVDGCINKLKTPINRGFFGGWKEAEYAQAFGALVEYKLIDYYEAKELNKELKKIHNVDLLKIYDDVYRKHDARAIRLLRDGKIAL